MHLYPAIDIKDGKCVRLTQGSFDRENVYSDSPLSIAEKWQSMGARFLHIVDLDAARSGDSVNFDIIKRIRKKIDIPIQLGGGIRSLGAASRMLNIGINRIIVGTKAVKDPEFMKELIHTFGPEAVVAGIDAKNGKVAVQGWEEISDMSALKLCLLMKEYGVNHVVYTDITLDGMLSGPNVEATKYLTDKTDLDIIASGGISGLGDLGRLSNAGIKGAIIGKALYERRIDLAEAVKKFEEPN